MQTPLSVADLRALTALMQVRVATLETAFARICSQRMAGLPVLNPALRVQAVDFQLHLDLHPAPSVWALGVLVTPWFMNLVRLPLDPAAQAAEPGAPSTRLHAGLLIDFLGAHEPPLQPFEACSLYSPMFEFAEQRAAVAVATEVLAQLRKAKEEEVLGNAARTPATPLPMPARRGFLLARRSVESRGPG